MKQEKQLGASNTELSEEELERVTGGMFGLELPGGPMFSSFWKGFHSVPKPPTSTNPGSGDPGQPGAPDGATPAGGGGQRT